MADSAREEKLAAARKKLKKFQQKRTPCSSPVVINKDVKHIEDSPVGSTLQGNTQISDTTNVAPHESSSSSSSSSSSVSVNGDYTPEENIIQTYEAIETGRDQPPAAIPNDREYSTTEKIKQLCNQLNGLMNQDLYINGEDPLFSEIESLEHRTHELEDKVQSYKRSNEQLNSQVNEQRRQIIQFQEQIKRERTELANKQLLEQRSLKEQLEVHIQTIGILVGEKQELQSTVSQLQRKYEIKQSENTELSSRLQTVRQKVIELEKNLANVTASSEKYSEDAKQMRQERDKYQTANYTHSHEKEELLQQNAELRLKLESKVAEWEEMSKTGMDLSFKLKQAELIVQQLSTEPNASAGQNLVHKLQEEKTELELKLDQVSSVMQRLVTEKGELLQQHADEVDHYEMRIRSLAEEMETCDREKRLLIVKESEVQETIQNLQRELAELRDDEATHQVESTQLAAVEIERLAEEKQRLAEHLQQEGRENSRLVREQQKYLLRIQELETAVTRLGEESIDKATLLETVQSDKETISRALKQNKDLKEKTEELEERFVKMSQENMEVTSSLETEKHMAQELALKLSAMGVELEEAKELLSSRNLEIQSLREELQSVSGRLKEEETSGESTISSLRDQLEISSQQLLNQVKHKEFEIISVREELESRCQGLRQELSQKELELVSLKNELSQSETRLSEQLRVNQDCLAYKSEAQLVSSLQGDLLVAQETISHLTLQNSQLTEMLSSQNHESSEASESEISDEDQVSERLPKDGTESEDGDVQITRVAPDVIPVQSPEQMLEEAPPYMNGNLNDGQTPADTDSSEEMNMATHGTQPPPPLSKYTNREDMVHSLSASIRQLEMERDQLADILHRTQDQQEEDFSRLQEHMELQLRQQLQQQYRQVQEQFQQHLHEQQQKIQLLQSVIEKQKEKIEQKEEPEIPNLPLDQLEQMDMSHEAIKMAFSKLQARFMKLMNEKATLIERIQELEHVTIQLSHETETIGEYITLYQTQRNALKSYYKDRERVITQLSSEKANMQDKMNQLQELVKRMLDERKDLRIQQHQLQSVINSRMVAHEHQAVIPSLQDSDEIITAQEASTQNETNTIADDSHESVGDNAGLVTESELSLDSDDELEQRDGTAQQILQILELLGPSEEGAQKGWMSPHVRTREFLPCRYCGSRILRL